MAGWVDSTSTGTGAGRGAGGRGFTNRRFTSDAIHGGGSSSSGGGSRWRGGERSRGRPPPQPHYRYRPVDAAHRHSSPSSGPALSEQPASSTSTHHAQIAHLASSTDKSSASGAATPSSNNSKEPDDKGSRNAANFECNVCFDMATEPVVTKCGHLFCWECLYQWLHVHSHHRECPVCKGQVADDAIIPIYGRGGSAASVNNAPPRPTGARIESYRHQQQDTFSHPMVYIDDDDDEDNPFADFPGISLGASSIRDAVMSFMPSTFNDVEMEDQYDDYSYEYNPDDFDEVYHYNLLHFPFVTDGVEAGNPSSSHAQAHWIDLTDSIIPGHHREFGYSSAHSHNRGRHSRPYRARASADQSSTDAMVTGSGVFYRDNSASSNVSAGASSRPNGGWAERRGRSNRNSNSAGGRGMQDSRRHRTNYS